MIKIPIMFLLHILDILNGQVVFVVSEEIRKQANCIQKSQKKF